MLFDIRVFLGKSYDGTSQTAEELLARMDALEIEQALAMPFKPISYNLDEANTGLAAAVKPFSDRLLWAARINPWQPTALESLRRAIETLGAKALYLNPWEETFRVDLERVDPLLELCREQRLPVVIAAGYPWLSEALEISNLAERWPDVSIVMTNGGQINISGLGQLNATLALSKNPNLFIETAGTYRQDFIEETVQAFGGERVLFGSGAPYFDQRFEILRVLLAKVSEKDKEWMKSGTARRLLGLAG